MDPDGDPAFHRSDTISAVQDVDQYNGEDDDFDELYNDDVNVGDVGLPPAFRNSRNSHAAAPARRCLPSRRHLSNTITTSNSNSSLPRPRGSRRRSISFNSHRRTPSRRLTISISSYRPTPSRLRRHLARRNRRSTCLPRHRLRITLPPSPIFRRRRPRALRRLSTTRSSRATDSTVQEGTMVAAPSAGVTAPAAQRSSWASSTGGRRTRIWRLSSASTGW
ncbi:hypothetical protein PR202_gb02824 [Eleusine coracana subsp. coracana]|uniref:Uncharacterized protein n=1 Tax=Eleusine coracana subsp. coracana TaxID=191504 RepID=A0AAV5DYP8_ELECO|nr:hypothetical protein PR202_gb02824 [Eleusine coracana subsp. coracana]